MEAATVVGEIHAGVIERQLQRGALAEVDADAGRLSAFASDAQGLGAEVHADGLEAAAGQKDDLASGAAADVQHRGSGGDQSAGDTAHQFLAGIAVVPVLEVLAGAVGLVPPAVDALRCFVVLSCAHACNLAQSTHTGGLRQ